MSKLLLCLLSFPAVAETLTGSLTFGPGQPFLTGKLETQPSKAFWTPSLSFEFPLRWSCGKFRGSCKADGGSITDYHADGLVPLFAMRVITFTFKFLPSVVTLNSSKLSGTIPISATGHITNRVYHPVTQKLISTVESDFNSTGEFVYQLAKTNTPTPPGTPELVLASASFFFPAR